MFLKRLGAFLENLQTTRSTSVESKALPLPQLEERLESIIRARGEQGLNAIRERAKQIAPSVGMEKQFKKLNTLISDLLATGKSKNLKSPAAIARALREPLDPDNRAGNTEFVDWQLTTGTLKKGFEWYSLLREPFAKAVYMMFLVSEVHPFLDGNGRIARVMMNAELSAKGLSKIIVPTVYREDYMGALRKLTRQRVADAYVRMLLRAYEFSSTLHGESIDEMERYLIGCDAFKEPKGGEFEDFI